MRTIGRSFGLALACMAASLGCRTIHNLPGIGPQIGDIFPTDDRYDRIVRVPISLDKPDNTAEIEFVPPFRGGYIVCIVSSGPKETQSALARYMHDHDTPLSVMLQLSQDGEVKLERPDDSFQNYYWDDAGFQIRGGFECPEDVEFGRSARMRLVVVAPDPILEAKFGPFVVFIRKVSDF